MKRQEAYFILIVTFVLVVLWIAFSILHSATDSTISSVINTQIADISPSFNTKIIENLKTRKQVTPLAGAPVVTPSASNSATTIQNPTPTPLPSIAPAAGLNSTNATNTAILTP